MKVILTLVIASMNFTLAAQDTWLQKADLPGGVRSASTMFSIDNTGYVFGGTYQGAAFNDLWAFDPTSNTWSEKASCPCEARWFAVSFVINGKGYICTGRSAITGGGLNDLWEYDPATDSWTEKAALPAPLRYSAFASSVNGKGYVGAGTGGTVYFDDLWQFDPIANSWSQKANYPDGPHFVFGGAFSIDDIIYVAGGRSSGGSAAISSDKLWAYDTDLDAWTQKASMPGQRLNAAAFSLNGRGYIVEGTTNIANGTLQSTTLEYDPIANTWTNRAAFAGGARTNVGGVAINGKAYVGIGLVSPTAFDDWYEYTPLDDATGINDEDRSGQLEVYPNPAIDHITVSLPQGSGELIILNGLGRTIHHERTSSDKVIISLDRSSVGVHQLIFKNKGTLIERRFIKL